MKKIRKTGLNRKVKGILKQLKEIRPLLITDILASNFNIVNINKYFPNSTYENGMIDIAKAILLEENIANEIIMELIKINNKNVKPFIDYSLEELTKEYQKGLMPSMSYTKSISADMMIMYYISNDMEKDERFEHALEYLDKDYEDFKQYKEQYEEVIKIKNLDGTLFQHAINAFYNGKEITLNPVSEEEVLEDLCNRYKATLTEERCMIINPQIIKFFDNEATKIVETQNNQKAISNVIMSITNKTFNYLKYAMGTEELYLQIDLLQKQNELVDNENQFLKAKLDEKSKRDGNEDIVKLEKENYYLKSKIEKLQLENEELKQTIKELKEIVEDLPITIEKIEPENTYSGESIVIVGGHWNNISKSEVRQDYLADFIEAEDVIKFTDRIRNYDVIIFDTSRNSHINFNRFKNNSKLKLISKSKKNDIDNLFIK